MSKDSYISSNRGFITNSKLEAFRFCPFYYRLKFLDEVVPDDDSLALKIGSALDDMLSSPDDFWNKWLEVSQEFDVEEKVAKLEDKAKASRDKKLEMAANAKTDATHDKYVAEAEVAYGEIMKEAAEVKKQLGKRQITSAQINQVNLMAEELKRQPLFHFEPKKAQVEIIAQKNGFKLKAKIDQFDPKKELAISDLKSSGGIKILLREFKDKYIRQLAFYQYVVYLDTGKIYDAELQVVTKDDPAKSVFFKITKERLREEWEAIELALKELEFSHKTGIFKVVEEEERFDKCFNCSAFGKCKNSKQSNHFILD